MPVGEKSVATPLPGLEVQSLYEVRATATLEKFTSTVDSLLRTANGPECVELDPHC